MINTDPWAKTGLMFRESTAPDSKFVMICITPGNGISLQWREVTGSSSNKKDFDSAETPLFLKLSKTASTFIAYKSMDGSEWYELGQVTLSQSFSEEHLVGLEVLSHTSHMLNTSKFDEVRIGSKQ